jgi:hypothetical protein
MRRGVAALVLGLALGVAAASSNSTANWRNLKYFDYESQHLVVATDGSWDGAEVALASKFQKPQQIQGPGLKKTNPSYIWVRTCGAGAQSVSFSKTILAPGDPEEGTLYLNLGFGRDLPFRSGELLVNGTRVARVVVPSGRFGGFPQAVSEPLSAKDRKAFRYGPNKLTIHADRKALRKGEACNSPNRLIGVLANLSLRFRPDLVAVPSDKGLEQAVRAAPGQTTGALGTLTFRNLGPSGSPGGRLVFTWAASGAIETAFGQSTFDLNPPFRSCKGEGLVSGTIECAYADYQVGRVAPIVVRAPARPTAKFTPTSSASLSISWQLVAVGGDVNGANNSSTHTIILCGAANKEPRCANAK